MKRFGAAVLVCIFAIGFTAAGNLTPDDRASDALPGPASDEWWAAAQWEIAKSEYQITWARTILPGLRAAYQAPNRAQGLRTYFTPQGIRMVPRSASSVPAWEWRVRLSGYGAANRVRPAAAPRLVVDGNRAEYRRSGLTEWYVNTERGLEHGFTLAAPLAPADTIQLDLALGGTLQPSWNAADRIVELLTPGGVRVLQYGGLHAHDAAGRPVPSAMTVAGASVIRIALDVSAAVFPVTVDPISTAAPWTAESNQMNAFFGSSVATAGDINRDGYSDVIVGAAWYDTQQPDAGQVFVYFGSATGLSATPNQTRSSSQAGSRFGYSVGTAGDVNSDGYSDVIVGAPFYSSGQTAEGVVWIYRGSSGGLLVNPFASFQSNQAGAWFGIAVGTAGDVNGDGFSDVIIGAMNYDNGHTDEGAVFVYHGALSSMSTVPAWTKEGNQTNAHLGQAAATAGDVNADGFADVIIGAPDYDNGSTDEGMVWVYRGGSSGLGSSYFWRKDGDQAGAHFGWSVATAGDTTGEGYSDVIIGAPHYSNGQSREGRIFMYQGWSSTMLLFWSYESNQADAYLGISVAPAGDVNGDGHGDIIAGASGYDGGEQNEGRVFVFDAANGNGTPTWMTESNKALAAFGAAVGTAGDVNGDGYADIIVGASSYSNGHSQEGRVFVYYGRVTDGLSSNGVQLPNSGSETSAYAGYAVASAGDVNGDGYGDVAVGAPWWDSGETDEGAVFIWYGRRWGVNAGYDRRIQGGITGGRLGRAVTGAGDTNGDGYDDLFMSQPGANGGKGYVRGAIGSASGISGLTWATGGTQVSEGFGTSISGAGDVNGDGYADLIVGAPSYDGGRGLADQGRVYLYTGGQFGMGSNIVWTATVNQANAQFGYSVGTAGDVNRDGYSDVIVGAPFVDHDQTNEGAAYIYHGSAAGLPTGLPSATREINQPGALFGSSVSTAGDVNRDGYSDVIVGSHLFDAGQIDEGAAFVYHGSPSGVGVFSNWMGQGDWSSAFYGWSVAAAGDVNGDGYSDVVVGGWGYDGFFTNQGRAYLYQGGPSGLASYLNHSWLASGGQSNAQFGHAVAGAGDVNADGYADVIVGAPFFDTPSGTDAGAAFLFRGNVYGGWGSSQRGNVPRQGRVNSNLLIGLLGRSDSSSAVKLIALAHSPFGRTAARLQWEIQPLGTPITGVVGGTSSLWQDTGLSGADVSAIVMGLSGGTGYHWRVRLRFRPSSSPFVQYTRWFTIPRNGINEKDFRTP